MPSPVNKRRRISEDGKSSPALEPTTPSRKANVLPSFMTPTKASLAKSYPHLVPKSPARGGGAQRIPSPVRQPPRRSIPPETLTEVITSGAPGRVFQGTANDGVEDRAGRPEPTGMAMNIQGREGKETHISSEEEIERQRGVLLRRLKLLRNECESLAQQVHQAKQTRHSTIEAQQRGQSSLDTIMYTLSNLESDYRQSLLRSNDSGLSRQPLMEPPLAKPSLPTAAPKQLKNPLPLLRFVHPITFYSTNSQLIPVDNALIRKFHLKGRAMEHELYFDLIMSVNEKQERITNLEIKVSAWARGELSTFLDQYVSSRIMTDLVCNQPRTLKWHRQHSQHMPKSQHSEV